MLCHFSPIYLNKKSLIDCMVKKIQFNIKMQQRSTLKHISAQKNEISVVQYLLLPSRADDCDIIKSNIPHMDVLWGQLLF